MTSSRVKVHHILPRSATLVHRKKILDSKGRRTSAPRQLFKYKRKAAPKCHTRRTCADGKPRRRINIITTKIPSLFFSEEDMYKLLFSYTIHLVETAMETNSCRVSTVKDPTVEIRSKWSAKFVHHGSRNFFLCRLSIMRRVN